ncbi:MAG: hypothetical protein U9Q92_00975 [archaeon]|nr:hypothetical protein [archaeon]
MTLDWNLIGSVLTFITIIVIASFNLIQYKQMQKQLKNQSEQIKLNFFSEYTQRYQEIILNFPENINEISFSYSKLDEKTRNKTMRYMRVYFDLCSEEFFLHQKKHIDDTVWKEWEEGMKISFKKDAFKKAWREIIKNSGFYNEFKVFVESLMNDE